MFDYYRADQVVNYWQTLVLYHSDLPLARGPTVYIRITSDLDIPPIPPILYRAFGNTNAFYTPTPAILASWLIAYDYDAEPPQHTIELCRCWAGGALITIYHNGTVAIGGTDPRRAIMTLAALLRPSQVEARAAQ